MAVWKIIATINLPNVITATVPVAAGELPKELKIAGILKGQIHYTIKNTAVKLIPWTVPSSIPDSYGPYFSPALISFATEAATPNQALLQSEDFLELILDDLSFQRQCAIRVFSLDVLDVTPPVSVGMQRQVLSFPAPNGFQPPKFLRSVSLGNVKPVHTLSLESEYRTEDESIRASIRWYVKALAAPFEIDKFVFYWIALEILCAQSDISVQKPYLARCGHEVPNCPTCGVSTIREVNGATIQKFLVESVGIDEKLAKEMWRMRQMFHGSNYLSAKATQELPRITMALQFAVARSLKQALNIPQDHPPVITLDTPIIRTDIALTGSREITEADL
jgi:hypothetical protein